MLRQRTNINIQPQLNKWKSFARKEFPDITDSDFKRVEDEVNSNQAAQISPITQDGVLAMYKSMYASGKAYGTESELKGTRDFLIQNYPGIENDLKRVEDEVNNGKELKAAAALVAAGQTVRPTVTVSDIISGKDIIKAPRESAPSIKSAPIQNPRYTIYQKTYDELSDEDVFGSLDHPGKITRITKLSDLNKVKTQLGTCLFKNGDSYAIQLLAKIVGVTPKLINIRNQIVEVLRGDSKQDIGATCKIINGLSVEPIISPEDFKNPDFDRTDIDTFMNYISVKCDTMCQVANRLRPGESGFKITTSSDALKEIRTGMRSDTNQPEEAFPLTVR